MGLISRAMSSSVTSVHLQIFKLLIASRIADSADLLTAGVYPQNIFCEGPLTNRGRKPYPRKSKLTVSCLPRRR